MTMTTSMASTALRNATRFAELNYQGNKHGTDFMWGVHVDGCKDIDRESRRELAMVTDHFMASSIREVLDWVVDGECRDMGWGDEHVYVAPCVKQALR